MKITDYSKVNVFFCQGSHPTESRTSNRSSLKCTKCKEPMTISGEIYSASAWEDSEGRPFIPLDVETPF